MTKTWQGSIFWVISASYPIWVFAGLYYLPGFAIVILLLLLSGLRLLYAFADSGVFKSTALVFPFALGIIAISYLILESNALLMLYPVIVNLTLFGVFAFSLIHGPCVIEQVARLTDKEISSRGIQYTKKVTVAWSVFFFINGLLSLWTLLLGDLKIWVFYNGFLSYVLAGIIFIIEWVIRQRVRMQEDV